MHNLYKILQDLDNANIYYSLARYRDDVVTIHVTIPGQRIEIDIEGDGTINTPFFRGNENVILGMEVINEIIAKNTE